MRERITSTHYLTTSPIIWVTPNQVTHGPLVRHLLHPIQIPRMIQRINRRRESSMQTKDAIGYHRSHGEVVKGVGEVLPNVGIAVFSKAFIVESVTVSGTIEGTWEWWVDSNSIKAEEFANGQNYLHQTYTWVICLLSWFPLKIVILSRNLTFNATNNVTVSKE